MQTLLIDFFGCKREQIVTCSWEDACERFPVAGIRIPDASAFISLGEALTGRKVFAAERLHQSTEPIYALCDVLTTALRQMGKKDLLEAGARWAEAPPWTEVDINPMDLSGFLLQLHSLVDGPANAENSIFLWTSGELPSA